MQRNVQIDEERRSLTGKADGLRNTTSQALSLLARDCEDGRRRTTRGFWSGWKILAKETRVNGKMALLLL